MPFRRLGVLAIAILALQVALGSAVAAFPAPVSAVGSAALAQEHTAYAPGAGGGTVDRGTFSGEFDCALGTMHALVSGNAYGPYPGTYSASTIGTFSGGTLTSLTVDFHIASGSTVIDGTASWNGAPVAYGCTTTDYGDGSGQVVAGPGGALHLNYVATIVGPGGTVNDDGTVRGAPLFRCYFYEVDGPLDCENGFFLDFEESVPDYASADAVPGLTVDTGFGEVTAADPMITLFRARTAGPVTINEGPTEPAPSGYQFIGQTAFVSGPPNPDFNMGFRTVDFGLDASVLPAGADETTLLLFGNGLLIPECDPDAETLAVPCVGGRFGLADGDVQIGLFAYDATGRWNVAVAKGTDPDHASGDRGPGGTIATGSGAATPDDPTTTAVTTPTAGTVTISEAPGGVAPAGYEYVGQSITITAPTGTAANPLRIVFRLDSTAVPDGYDASTIEVFRNGVLVSSCASMGSGQAVPTPCVDDRTALPDGDVQLTALTVQASVWDLAVRLPPSADGTIAAVQTLPASALKAPGNRSALTSRLSDVNAAIAAGDTRAATKQLTNLRKQVNGCGTKADKDDWIVNCPTQLEIRSQIDELLARLGG